MRINKETDYPIQYYNDTVLGREGLGTTVEVFFENCKRRGKVVRCDGISGNDIIIIKLDNSNMYLLGSECKFEFIDN